MTAPDAAGTTEVVWLRRDLRTDDHPALAAASAGADRVVPLFVLDPAVLDGPRTGAPRRAYLADALAGLDADLRALGGRLVVHRGDPRAVVPRVAADVGATRVRWSADVSPFAVRRDAAVAERLRAAGCAVVEHDGLLVHPPGAVTTSAGTAYRVFTPFLRAWWRRDPGAPVPPPTRLDVPEGAAGLAVPSRADLAAGTAATDQAGGPAAAARRLEAFLADGVATYHHRRDVLAAEGTSRLSADLHFGCLSPRAVLARLDPTEDGPAAFAAELAWRDFYAHVLHAFPEAASTEFDPAWRALPWEQDGPAYRAWRDGETGFPVVDAAARQLAATGWMHNRARMIVASFLTKHLRVDWRLGEAHFLRSLTDGDVASNNGGWQWAAGTGTDAQPYFRVFNPVRQGARFDADGAYVRRWVPELAGVPRRWAHAPWTLPAAEARAAGVTVGEDYPGPMVDHPAERERTIAWFAEHRRPC